MNKTDELTENQIKDIVGKWFEYGLDRGEVRSITFQDRYTKLTDERLSDYEKGKIDTRQKPTVTEVEALLAGLSRLDEGHYFATDVRFIIDWLKEIGVEVAE